MAPSAKALREALIQGTCDVFKLGPDTTTVNKVRHHVEQELGLDEDFFNGGDWKQKSKEIIKEHVVSLFAPQCATPAELASAYNACDRAS